MLVLTRKTNESIVVSDDIKITVIRVSGNKVKLGIQAPPEVSIAREELLIQQQEEFELEISSGPQSMCG